MRLIFGIIIGAVLTIGAAYIHDSKVHGPFAEQQRLVNWEAAGGLARDAYARIHQQFKEWTGY